LRNEGCIKIFAFLDTKSQFYTFQVIVFVCCIVTQTLMYFYISVYLHNFAAKELLSLGAMKDFITKAIW